MRLTPDQLTAHVEKPLLPLYLICSDIPLLTQEASQEIKNAAQNKGYTINPTLEAHGSFDWQEFHASMQNLSLLSPQTVVQINLGEKAPKQEIINKNILPYINTVMTNKIIILYINKLDSRTQNTAWIKTLDKIGAIIQIWPISAEQFPRWLNQRMQKRGLSAQASDIQLIANCFEGNILAAAQHIEKLYLLYSSDNLNNKKINNKEITESLADNTKYEVFQWINYALESNSKKVIHSLYRLKKDNNEPGLLLWTMAKELRRLFFILNSLELDPKKTPELLFAEQKIWKKHYFLYKNCIKKTKKQTIEKLLAKIYKLDLIIKNSEPGDIWNELLILSLELAGKSL